MISSTMKTGSNLRAFALVFCLVLVSQLPKLTETLAGNNYPQSLRRIAGATLSPIDTRTQYQLLDANSLVSNDTGSSNLLQSQQRAPASDVAQGYYAFEVAPNMEPPSVPKPPFKSIESACVGSDMFAPFTYKDTLCGNLYHGKVPRNPMGQMVDEQAYPFELIKNKTLQFLAKSLPILKEEASSLPRVYKYNNLPANQLLNPTNIQSPLGHEHLDRLNQRQLDLYPEMAHSETYAAPPFLRKKRSAVMLPNQQQQQQATAIEVAELTSNATLVVKSAHSGNGRTLSQRSADGITMITKEGPRPIAQNAANVNGASARSRAQQQQDDQQRVGQSIGGVRSNAPSGHQLSGQQQQLLKSHAANQIGAIGQIQSASNTISGQEHASQPSQTLDSGTTNSNAPAHTNPNSNSRQQQQRSVANGDGHLHGQQSADSTPVVVARNNADQSQSQPQQPSASPHRVAPAAGALAQRPANGVRAGSGGGNPPAKCSGGSPLMQAVCQAATALIEPPSDTVPVWMQKLKQATAFYKLYESFTNSPPATTASSLLTFWNSLPSGLGGTSGGSASEKYATSDEANVISDQGVAFKSAAPLTASSSQTAPKASPPVSPAVSSVTTILNLLNPLFSLFQPSLQRADSSPVVTTTTTGQTNQSSSSGPVARNSSRVQTGGGLLSNGLKSMANLLITSLSTAYLVDWLTGSNIISPMLTTTSFARRKNPFDRSETFAPASLAAMQSAKQLSPAAISTNQIANGEMPKAPPTPCPSKEELVAPTFARNYQGHWKYIVQIPSEGYFTQTIQKSVCERQKCEFTEGFCHEAPRWVSLLVAEIYYPHSSAPQTQLSTPMATNELINERLAFDVGGQPNAAGLLNQFMTAASSNSQLQQAALGAGQHQARSRDAHHHHHRQQDPLQMIDSSNTYNHHNLNNLFLNSAAELGLDPMNLVQMRQFADAHNYQFVQRYGQQSAENSLNPYYSYQQQQSIPQSVPVSQHAEARSSNGGDQMGGRQQQQYAQALWSQPATQFYVQPQQTQQVLSQEQIQQLAMRLIQANPGKSPQELINMIQQRQLTRKKRDSSESGDTNRQQTTPVMTAAQQQQQFGHKLDQATGQMSGNQQMARSHANQQAPHQQTASSSSSAENLASINELNQLPQQQQQQQTYQLHGQQPYDPTGLSAPAQLSSSQLHYQQPVAGVRSQINGFQQTPRTNQVDQQKSSQLLPAAGQPQLAFNAAIQHGSQTGHNQAAQTQADQLNASSDLNAGGAGQGVGSANEPQVECDGHDARGCYVVRVYYDWFLVNGSCKCWKMGATDQQRSSQSQGSSSGANFIRRIFTAG